MPAFVHFLPLSDPVLLLAFVLPVVFLVPLLSERLRVPGVVGLILAGIALGPKGLGIFEGSGLIGALSEAGLLFVMFIAGAEIDLVMFSKYRVQSAAFGAVSFVLPVVAGTALGLAQGWHWPAAVLLGAVFASHTLIAYPLAVKLGIGKSLPVTVAVGGTLLSDILALTVLAIVAGSAHGRLDAVLVLRIALELGVFVTLVLIGVPRLGRAFFRNIGSRLDSEFLFVLSVVFGIAALARLFGLEPIIGAFMAGLALNRFLPEHGQLLRRLRFVGNTLFVPFFLLATGMLVEPKLLVGHPGVWELAGSLLAAVKATKYLATWLCGWKWRFDVAERLVMFGLTTPQAAATLAATTVGFELGLFDLRTVNAIVILILVTCLLGPLIVDRAGRVVAQRKPHPDEGRPICPQRILVPIANPSTARSLLDLAQTLRGTGEPVFALTVVSPTSGRPQAAVAQAEEVLAAAIADGIGDPGIQALTRVASGVAAAVAVAALETRSATVVLGWNGKRSISRWVFGSVIDQVLEQTPSQVAVARLQAPLAAFDRLVVILPQLASRQPGWEAVCRAMAVLGQVMGPVTIWTVGCDVASGAIEKQIPGCRIERVADWKAISWLLSTAGSRDLIAAVSARRGEPAWNPVLENLPGLLASRPGRSFLVLYPAQGEPGLSPAAFQQSVQHPGGVAQRASGSDTTAAGRIGALKTWAHRPISGMDSIWRAGVQIDKP